MAIAPAATVAAPPAAAAGAGLARPGEAYIDSAPGQFFAVQSCEGLLRLFRRTHGDESKPARPAGIPVFYYGDLDNRAARAKRVAQRVLRDLKIKISDVQLLVHSIKLFWTVLRSPYCSRRSGLKSSLNEVQLTVSMSWK